MNEKLGGIKKIIFKVAWNFALKRKKIKIITNLMK